MQKLNLNTLIRLSGTFSPSSDLRPPSPEGRRGFDRGSLNREKGFCKLLKEGEGVLRKDS
jgi:hypothetical protein